MAKRRGPAAGEIDGAGDAFGSDDVAAFERGSEEGGVGERVEVGERVSGQAPHDVGVREENA